MATQGTSTDLKRESQGPTTMESCSSLSPWLEVPGDSVPVAWQQHLLAMAGAGHEACPASRPVQLPQWCQDGARMTPGSGDTGMCPAGPAGFSSPTAAGDVMR